MRIIPWKRIAVATVVVATSVGAGAAWADQSQGPTAQTDAAAPTPSIRSQVIGTGVNDVKFVPVTPCRLVDTRVPGQRFARDQIRVFDIRGSGSTFAAQGGKAGGCGIPEAVTAVEITVSAVAADGNGFLRVYPDVQPTASFLSFNGTSSSSNTGTVSICGHAGAMCVANQDLHVKAFGSATDVVIDIAGYYARPMAGRIEANGTTFSNRSSRITNVTAGVDGPGSFTVTFDRNVNNCVPMVSPAPGTNNYNVYVGNHSGDVKSMFVRTVSANGTPRAYRFNIEVTC